MLAEIIALQARAAAEGVAAHWLNLVVAAWLGFVSWALWHRTKEHKLALRRDRLLREELEAYARLDATLPLGADPRAFAKRVCRMVSDKSAFRKSALLLRNAEGRLYVAGSAGMDDLAVAALAAWGAEVVEQERSAVADPAPRHALPPEAFAGARVGAKSFLLDLPHEDGLHPLPSPLPAGRPRLRDIHGRAILLPLRTSPGSLAGALAVSPEAELPPWTPTLEEAVPPLETLAGRLARTLESAALAERLALAEKLIAAQLHAAELHAAELPAALAQELSHPLTAVLGFAELTAGTASESRVRDDAQSIIAEALRMKTILHKHLPPDGLGINQHDPTPIALREIA